MLGGDDTMWSCSLGRRGHRDRLDHCRRTGRDDATHPQRMIPKSVARPAVPSAWSDGRGGLRVIGRRSAVAASSGKADPGGWLTASTFAALDRFVGCFEVTWRSVRSDLVARVLWGLPENIAADIGVGRSLALTIRPL